MTNRFTENARRVLSDAARTAGELGHAHIGSEHILLAITLDGESTAMRVLKGAGITSDGVRRRIIALCAHGRRHDAAVQKAAAGFVGVQPQPAVRLHRQ